MWSSSIAGGGVIGHGTVLGQLDRPVVGMTCADPDLPYVVQEDRLPPGRLSLWHGASIVPFGSDTCLTDSDTREW